MYISLKKILKKRCIHDGQSLLNYFLRQCAGRIGFLYIASERLTIFRICQEPRFDPGKQLLGNVQFLTGEQTLLRGAWIDINGKYVDEILDGCTHVNVRINNVQILIAGN